MKKSIFALLALFIIALAGTAAIAARPDSDSPGSHHRQKAFRPGQIKHALNLSDDQVAKIKTEFSAQKDAMKAQALKVRSARANLRTAIQSGAPENDIRAAAASVGAAEGDLAMVRANLVAHIKPILTPEQFEKLQALQAKRARL
ncbi:MAG: periplasmic heavy metal sensor [Nibricoccus sp.]